MLSASSIHFYSLQGHIRSGEKIRNKKLYCAMCMYVHYEDDGGDSGWGGYSSKDGGGGGCDTAGGSGCNSGGGFCNSGMVALTETAVAVTATWWL